MRWKSSGDRYGAVATMIHWLTAFAVIGLLTTGLVMAGETDPEVRAALLRVHVPMGVLVLVLTIGRIAWWVFFDRRPDAVKSGSTVQMMAAKVVHIAFYPLLLAGAGSGTAMMALSGAAAVLFFGASGPLPDFWDYAPRMPHRVFAYALIALVVLHVAAALFHQFVKRDGLLARVGLFAWPKGQPSAKLEGVSAPVRR